VDGGVVNNVPCSLVWSAGADFVIGSNVIPRRPQAPDDAGLTRRVLRRFPIVPGRANDVLRSMYLLMNENGLRQAANRSDVVVGFDEPDYVPWAFDRGPEIAELGYRAAIEQMPDLRAAWDDDDTVHFPKPLR